MTQKNKAITLEDIARLAGVSTASVSRALNNSNLIKAETKKHILEIARQNNYALNYGAQSLSRQKSNVIALYIPVFSKKAVQIAPIISDPFFLKILSGMLSETSANDYDLVVNTYDGDDHDRIYQSVLSKKVGGAIIYGDDAFNWENEICPENKLPIVFWGGKTSENFYKVATDDLAGAALAANKLMEKGAKNLAYIGGNESGCVAKDRGKGFVNQVKKNGGEVKKHNISFGSYFPQSGYDQMKALFENDPTIDGVFACSDVLAQNAIKYLHSVNKNIPNDIKVIGYDNIDIAANHKPSLTTIDQDGFIIGKTLTKKMMEIIETPETAKAVKIVDIQLIERESC